jgi:predicted transcriptional regulator
MKYFFWIAFAVFLAASIPHVAYFFASFEPSQGPEGIWWWAVSYAIAISIDVTVYLLSWTAFQRYRRYRTPKAVWQHWLLIVMCTIFSWAVNWAYAKQFHSPAMLSAAESAAPWLIDVFPFMASAFPLLGIVYTMMAETISETSSEDRQILTQELTALSELAKQTNLPIASLRRALTGGSRVNAASLLTEIANDMDEQNSEATSTTAVVDKNDTAKAKAITGQFVTIEKENTGSLKNSNPALQVVNGEGNSDKLQMTIEALRKNPDMTDEALAEHLALKRPASARFWRLKAIEILSANRKEAKSGPVALNGWASQ